MVEWLLFAVVLMWSELLYLYIGNISREHSYVGQGTLKVYCFLIISLFSFFFWNWQNKFSPMPSGKAVVLPPSHAYLCHRYHDYPRLRLSSILVYSWCLVQCLTNRYVLSKCEHLLDQSLEYSLVWKKWVRGHDFAH